MVEWIVPIIRQAAQPSRTANSAPDGFIDQPAAHPVRAGQIGLRRSIRDGIGNIRYRVRFFPMLMAKLEQSIRFASPA